MLSKVIFAMLFLFSIALCSDLLTVLARGAHAYSHSYGSHPFRTYKTHRHHLRSASGGLDRGSSQHKAET